MGTTWVYSSTYDRVYVFARTQQIVIIICYVWPCIELVSHHQNWWFSVIYLPIQAKAYLGKVSLGKVPSEILPG